ncbi:hypothetical protein [Dokdonia sp.]|uniref:hypothetical protein n=1 Tax=Dokdonia sp. TaxID=2024995 RepID=UPI0032636474
MKKLLLTLLCIGTILSCSKEEIDIDDANNFSSDFKTSTRMMSTCFFASNPTLTSNQFGNAAILMWDLTNVIFDEDIIFTTNQIEVRVYDVEFCKGVINVDPTITFHDIPDILNSPTGTLTLFFGQDFDEKCFEWRINTIGGISTDTSPFQSVDTCSNNTPFFLHMVQ